MLGCEECGMLQLYPGFLSSPHRETGSKVELIFGSPQPARTCNSAASLAPGGPGLLQFTNPARLHLVHSAPKSRPPRIWQMFESRHNMC